MSNQKHLKVVILKNFMGLAPEDAELKFELGKFNLVRGSNGEGKSRFLKAIEILLSDRMTIATANTVGSDKPTEIIGYFDDGTKDEVVIKKGKAKRIIEDPEGRKIGNGRELITGGINALAIDAGKFLDPKEKKYRISTIIDILGLMLNREQWIKKVGNDFIPNIDFTLSAFEQFKNAEDYYMGKRREENRVIKENEATIETLERSLPEETEIDYKVRLEKERSKLAAIDNTYDSKIENVFAKAEKIGLEKKKELDFLNQQFQEIKEAITIKENEIQKVKDDYGVQKNEFNRKKEADKESINHTIDKIQEEIEKQVKSETTIKYIYDSKKRVKKHQELSKTFDELVKLVRQWKGDMLRDNPIPELSIAEDGSDISIDNFTWEQCNTGRQVKIALKIATHKSPEIPIVLFDNIEALDNETTKELMTQMEDKNFQAIFAKVSEEIQNLKIEKINGAVNGSYYK